MDQLSLGVLSESRKENEHRLPIHPLHFDRIEPGLRERILLERGYGARFGIRDHELAPLVKGVLSRAEVIAESEVIVLPKPLHSDVRELRAGQILWGWPHCVQDAEMAQLAIDQRLTLIAWEAMNHWSSDGSYNLHVFHKNNELAGYCSVLHAMQIIGSTGNYGRRLRAAVIGFGATGRGAVTALNAHGVHEVDNLTDRDVTSVASPIHSARIKQLVRDAEGPGRAIVLSDEGSQPLAPFLAEHDIIVNCVLQDTNAPVTFLSHDDLPLLEPGSLIVDVSCDEGMGFSWAKPTSFDQPTFVVGNNVIYYGVDHSPSYLWNSTTWELSEALMPYLPTVLAGPSAWERNETIRRAIEIRDGVIQNPNILAFQNRAPEYPHAAL